MKKVIERIVKELENVSYFTESTYDEDGYSNDDSEEVVNLCKAVEIVKRVLEDGWWIPVEERLPEDKQQVLVTNWDHSVFPARYDEDGKRFVDIRNGLVLPLILAWMPLPKPYKEKGE